MTAFPDLRPAFPHTAEFQVHGHTTLHDIDFQPDCGYVSVQEARLLWQCAREFPGVWCEIGSHTGWSGAHIAHGLRLDTIYTWGALAMYGEDKRPSLVAVEPQFIDLAFFRRARDNWYRCAVDDCVFPFAGRSADYFAQCRETFSGCFVDGCHDPGEPLRDARMLLPRLAHRAVVLFHDSVGDPVWEAARFMQHQGFQVREMETMARMLVCWRGEWDGPEL